MKSVVSDGLGTTFESMSNEVVSGIMLTTIVISRLESRVDVPIFQAH